MRNADARLILGVTVVVVLVSTLLCKTDDEVYTASQLTVTSAPTGTLTVVATSTPSIALPDLLVREASNVCYDLHGPLECFYSIRIHNRGAAPAGPFAIQLESAGGGTEEVRLDTLGIHNDHSRQGWFILNRVTVDLYDEVP